MDYLPSQYNERVFFIVTGIEQIISDDGWQTRLETQMHVRYDSLLRPLYKRASNIYLSSKWLEQIGVHPHITEMFKNFKLDGKTSNGVLVFNVEGRKTKRFSPSKTFSEHGSRQFFMTPLVAKSVRNPNTTFKRIKVEINKPYKLAVCVDGGIAFPGDQDITHEVEAMRAQIINYVSFRGFGKPSSYTDEASGIGGESLDWRDYDI